MSPPENTPRAFHTSGMIDAFKKSGYDVDVIIPDTQYNYENSNIYVVKPYFRNKPKYSMTIQRFGSGRVSLLSSIKTKINRMIGYFVWPDKTVPFAYYAYQKIKELDKTYDVIMTISGPYSSLIAGYLAKKHGYAKMWIADYGDPFSGLEHGTTRFYDAFLEKQVLSNVDFVTIPDQVAKQSYKHLISEEKIHIIPQQFQWNPVATDYAIDPTKINIVYAGKMYPKRPPDDMIVLLKNNNRNNIVLHMFGDTEYFKSFLQDKKNELLFQGEIKYNGFVNRSELLDIFTKMDYLINIEWPTSNQKPSKLIDYKIANRTIINLPQDKDCILVKQPFFQGINQTFLDVNESFAINFIQYIEQSDHGIKQ